MDAIRGCIRQLRHPLSDKGSIRIAFLTLGHGVENTEIRSGIGATSRTPLPTAVVGGQIAIHQRPHKVAFTPLPRDHQILGQKHGHNHPEPVVHPPRGIQASHGRIDDRISGLTGAPRVKLPISSLPLDLIVLWAKGPRCDARMIGQNLNVELSPNELTEPRVAGFQTSRRRGPRPGCLQSIQNHPDSHRPKTQMR